MAINLAIALIGLAFEEPFLPDETILFDLLEFALCFLFIEFIILTPFKLLTVINYQYLNAIFIPNSIFFGFSVKKGLELRFKSNLTG